MSLIKSHREQVQLSADILSLLKSDDYKARYQLVEVAIDLLDFHIWSWTD